MPLLQQIQMNSSEFQPLADYILVKPDGVETDEFTECGIIIQHKKSITNRPCSGVILAKGYDCTEVEVGDYIVFPDTDGIDVKFLDSKPNVEYAEFMLLRYKSIIGKQSRKDTKL